MVLLPPTRNAIHKGSLVYNSLKRGFVKVINKRVREITYKVLERKIPLSQTAYCGGTVDLLKKNRR